MGLLTCHADPKTTTQDEDTEITPKARKPVPRTFSAGAFLRSELQRGSSEANDISLLYALSTTAMN